MMTAIYELAPGPAYSFVAVFEEDSQAQRLIRLMGRPWRYKTVVVPAKVQMLFRMMPRALEAIADVVTKNGGEKRDTWEGQSFEEHWDHAVEHVKNELAQDKSEDHKAHAATRGVMALEVKLRQSTN